MGTILDSLTALATPAVGQVADRLGESNTAVSRGMRASFASVLAALVNKTQDTSALNPIYDLINQRAGGTHLAGDVQSMVDDVAPGAPSTGPAATLLKSLFGDRVNAVANVITSHAGFVSPKSAGSLLAFAAPLAFAFIGKQVRDQGMNVGGLSKLLLNERQNIMAVAPNGLASIVDTGGLLSHTAVSEGARRAATAGGGVRNWAWPAAIVAAVLVGWFAFARGRAPSTPEVIQSGAGAVKAAGGEVTEAVTGLGAFVKHTLPGGVELNIPPRGIESSLIAFIEDPSRPVNDTTWFDFDRLNFATGSATILPDSREQVGNIAAVLKAYPTVTVKVGGYTDNVGSAAANLRLSQRRADAVRDALVEQGIPANRLTTEGYGPEHPVASNDTEEGRAKNRRIALKVTKK